MNRSTPGLPVHHQLPEFTQTHVHQVSDAIQPSHPLCDPIDGSLPGSSAHGIFQARVLEWVAIAFSDELNMEQRSALGFLWKE